MDESFGRSARDVRKTGIQTRMIWKKEKRYDYILGMRHLLGREGGNV